MAWERIGIAQQITLVVWVIVTLNLTCQIIYFTYQYWKVKEAIVLRKRYPQIVIFTAVVGVLLQGRGVMFQFIVSYRDEAKWVDLVHTFFYPITIHALIFCFIWRYWMIYYRFNWIAASQNSQWMRHINEKVNY